MRKKTAIVPSLVLTASFATVIPSVAACSGSDPVVGSKDARPDTIWYGVAAVAYCCFEAGVADMGFDADAAVVSEAEAGEAGDARDGG